MIIVKVILFIIASTLLLKAVIEEDFNDLFFSIFFYAIAFGIEII